MLLDDLRGAFLTSELTDEQLAELLEVGQEQRFGPDEELFHEGEPADFLWILLEGRIELTRRSANQVIVLTTMATPGQWAGGLRAWEADGESGYRASGRTLGDGRVFTVPSKELGRLVAAWMPFAKHMITGVYQTIRSIDATARQRESLVALGTMAAGLLISWASPAAASLRAVEQLRQTCDDMLAALAQLAEQAVSPGQLLELDQLRLDLVDRSAPGEDDPVSRMDREEEIGVWLEDRGIARAWQIAGVLGAAGADVGWFDDLERSVGAAAVGPAARWTTTTISAASLLGELTDATERVARLVADVKAYSQLDRAALQEIDVHAGIEATLALLAPKLARIEVTKDFAPDLPEIDAYASELNQVWMNLDDNAVDAMEGRGALRIATRADGDRVVVEVTDSGPGIPADVLGRVFEPFFTTKDVGKGTGLGLDITRRIVVDRHGGDITFRSAPGETTAVVSLPHSR